MSSDFPGGNQLSRPAYTEEMAQRGETSMLGGMTPANALGGGFTMIDPLTGLPRGAMPQGRPPEFAGMPDDMYNDMTAHQQRLEENARKSGLPLGVVLDNHAVKPWERWMMDNSYSPPATSMPNGQDALMERIRYGPATSMPNGPGGIMGNPYRPAVDHAYGQTQQMPAPPILDMRQQTPPQQSLFQPPNTAQQIASPVPGPQKLIDLLTPPPPRAAAPQPAPAPVAQPAPRPVAQPAPAPGFDMSQLLNTADMVQGPDGTFMSSTERARQMQRQPAPAPIAQPQPAPAPIAQPQPRMPTQATQGYQSRIAPPALATPKATPKSTPKSTPVKQAPVKRAAVNPFARAGRRR
jgi:hypothetical protein